MAWRWDAELASGLQVTPGELDEAGLGQEFESQQLAEEWLTAFYAELTDLGVSAVTLFEEDRLVYGPMSLDEA